MQYSILSVVTFKLQEEASKNLQAMKTVLYGSVENEPQSEVVAVLAQETYNYGVIPLVITNLIKLDFEAGETGFWSVL